MNHLIQESSLTLSIYQQEILMLGISKLQLEYQRIPHQELRPGVTAKFPLMTLLVGIISRIPLTFFCVLNNQLTNIKISSNSILFGTTHPHTHYSNYLVIHITLIFISQRSTLINQSVNLICIFNGFSFYHLETRDCLELCMCMISYLSDKLNI